MIVVDNLFRAPARLWQSLPCEGTAAVFHSSSILMTQLPMLVPRNGQRKNLNRHWLNEASLLVGMRALLRQRPATFVL